LAARVLQLAPDCTHHSPRYGWRHGVVHPTFAANLERGIGLQLQVTNADVREQKGTVVQPLVRPDQKHLATGKTMDSVIVFRTPRDFGGNFREGMQKNTINNAGDDSPIHEWAS